jgi:hypothetical protein
MEQLTKDGFERVMESLATFTYRPRPMIAVHPIEHPLWQALFGGTLPVTDFNSKRNELFRRFEAGEFAGAVTSRSRDVCRPLSSP